MTRGCAEHEQQRTGPNRPVGPPSALLTLLIYNLAKQDHHLLNALYQVMQEHLSCYRRGRGNHFAEFIAGVPSPEKSRWEQVSPRRIGCPATNGWGGTVKTEHPKMD